LSIIIDKNPFQYSKSILKDDKIKNQQTKLKIGAEKALAQK